MSYNFVVCSFLFEDNKLHSDTGDNNANCVYDL
jgi:hypothetical protein